MRIKTLFCHNSLKNLIHILVDEKSGQAICVDPFDADLAADYLSKEGLGLKYIINTHEHWDHIRGNQALKKISGAKILSVNEVKNIDQIILDQEQIHLGNLKLKFFHTPGHTQNHISFIVNDEALFCGDTLFNAGVGRCTNGGDVDVLYATFASFYNKLDDKIKVYPGHDYIENNLNFAKEYEPSNRAIDLMLSKAKEVKDKDRFIVTSLAEERKYNPFLRLKSQEIVKRSQANHPTEINVFRKLRSLRDRW